MEIRKVNKILFYQICRNCGDIATPECEKHTCHKCGKAKYEPYKEYDSQIINNEK